MWEVAVRVARRAGLGPWLLASGGKRRHPMFVRVDPTAAPGPAPPPSLPPAPAAPGTALSGCGTVPAWAAHSWSTQVRSDAVFAGDAQRSTAQRSTAPLHRWGRRCVVGAGPGAVPSWSVHQLARQALCRLAARASAAPRPGYMQTTGWAPCRCMLACWQQPAARRCCFSGALQGWLAAEVRAARGAACLAPMQPCLLAEVGRAHAAVASLAGGSQASATACTRPAAMQAGSRRPAAHRNPGLPPSRGQQHRQRRQRSWSSRRRSGDGC